MVAYSGAVMIALPSENIARDLVGLLLLEFFHGMLYPTTRTKVLSGRIPAQESFGFMTLAATVGLIALVMFVGNIFALICLGFYFLV